MLDSRQLPEVIALLHPEGWTGLIRSHLRMRYTLRTRKVKGHVLRSSPTCVRSINSKSRDKAALSTMRNKTRDIGRGGRCSSNDIEKLGRLVHENSQGTANKCGGKILAVKVTRIFPSER